MESQWTEENEGKTIEKGKAAGKKEDMKMEFLAFLQDQLFRFLTISLLAYKPEWLTTVEKQLWKNELH